MRNIHDGGVRGGLFGGRVCLNLVGVCLNFVGVCLHLMSVC